MKRYERQMLLPGWGEDGQKKLLASRVTLVGCGALGTGIANNLARAGVGFLRICDRDFVELNNLHRQMLFDEGDVAAQMPKAEAAARHLREVNSEITIEPVACDVNFTNVEKLIREADVVIDGSDNFATRYLLNDACVKNKKCWIYGGAVATYGVVMPIVPEKTACLRCVFPALPAAGAPTCDTSGVLNAASLTIASLQSAEAIKMLTGNDAAMLPGMMQIDVWANSYRKISPQQDPDCVCCGKRVFEFLQGDAEALLTSLCGRNAVQIVQRQAQPVDMQAMRTAFEKIGSVTANKFLLKVKVGENDITLFPDGRALIGGTTDASVAKTLYAKYVGA